ncbi:efflux RND transporter periplasmic adaptor subunit [Massilia sp. B-10]|nr:efflux RND transporter periplasmic adaptor subunit [Massilia sp. B-10]
MSDAEIGAIERAGKPRRVVTLSAPRSGVLAHRGIAAKHRGRSRDRNRDCARPVAGVGGGRGARARGLSNIKKGMLAQLSFGGAAAAPVAARVEFIDPMLTEATRTLRVRFSLPNPVGALRPGMYGTAQFKAPPRQALMVARDAVVDTGTAQYVYVVDGDGMYVPCTVQVGARLKDTVEIVEGLQDGEKIVASRRLPARFGKPPARLRRPGDFARRTRQGRCRAGAASAAHAAGEGRHD